MLHIDASVFGPFIENLSPVVGDTGTAISLLGEGFFGPVAVTSGDSALANPTLISNSSVTAVSVARLPIGPLTITTPLGSTSSSRPFVPLIPRGVIPFYPFADFVIADSGSCVAPRRLRLLQDGSRAGFVVDFHRPLPEDVVLDLGIDNDNRPASIEVPLSVRRTAGVVEASGTPDALGGFDVGTAVVVAEFASLDLHDVEKLGRLFVQLSVSAPCGSAAFPIASSAMERAGFVDIRSAFAPGLVLVRTAAPAAVAAAHGLHYFTTAEDSDIAAMGLLPGRRLEDVLVELASDPRTNGAIMDPVLYGSSHLGSETRCGSSSPFFDTGTTPLPARGQWTLAQIGLEPHPSALAGSGVIVAVLGSGVDPHPDIAPNLIPGFNVLLLGDGLTTDVDPSGLGHDTGVASVIAATQGNGGMVGVAPGASILPVRVTNGMGMTDGFGLFRAFSVLIRLKTTTLPGVQVANVSMAEFVDTILVAASVLTGLGLPPGVGGSVNLTLHQRANALIGTGVALVVSSGNSGAELYGFAGMQYPANVTGAFAIGGLDSTRTPLTISTRAAAGQRIALAAPSSSTLVASSTGGVATTMGGYICVRGTSFAAPLVSGAIANVLSPSPPRIPTLTTGVAAGNSLVASATRLPSAPLNAVGAGELNLRLPVPPPSLRAFSWSFDFQSSAGLIDDFAFLPGVGDFALREGGTVLERMDGPNETVSFVTRFPASRSWMVATSNLLAFGTATRVEARGPGGSITGAIAGTSFRAGVSPFSIGGGRLVALTNLSGGARIRFQVTGADLANITPPAGETFLGAHFAGMPAFPAEPIAPFVLALRTPSVVQYYRVPATIASGDCPLEQLLSVFGGAPPVSCPVLLGTSNVASVTGVVDWAFTAGSLGPTSYFVNGSGNVFVAPINTTAAIPVEVGLPQRYIGLAANPRIEAVYAVDVDNTQFAMLRGTSIIGVDRSRAGIPHYGSASFIRIAPSGTYGYIQTGVGTLGSNRAIFVGFLAP